MFLKANSLMTVGACALLLAIAGATPTFAAAGGGGGGAGGGGGGGGTGSGSGGGSGGSAETGPQPTAPVDCKKLHKNDPHPESWIFSFSSNRCVTKTSMNDKELYQQGHDYAVAGLYNDALDALNAIRDKNDAMVLTMIGYSKRKLGNYDEGLAFYAKALAIDPSNVNTHEYLGEAYAEKGKLDLAKAELVKVAAVCGTTCEQYQDLAKAIASAPTA